MNKKLYVGNLSYETTEDTLRNLFGGDGREVALVSIVMDKMSGRSRGFAFVEMATPEGADAARSALDGMLVDGRTIRVNEARERPAGGPGGGGGFRGGRGGGGGAGRDGFRSRFGGRGGSGGGSGGSGGRNGGGGRRGGFGGGRGGGFGDDNQGNRYEE